ncbi:MAG: hypothetical protein ACK5T6_17500, partial [Pirellula sp.]
MDGLAGNGESRFPSLSFDGGILAYTSAANNLVPGDTTGGDAGAIWGRSDTFIYNVFTSQTTMITPGSGSVSANRTSQFPMVSGNGRYIAFISWATDFLSNDTNNLGDVIRFDRVSGTFERVVPTGINGLGNGTYAACPIDFSGNAITYMSEMNQIVPGDNDSITDVFVLDFSAPQTTLITKAVTQTDVNAPNLKRISFPIFAERSEVLFRRIATWNEFAITRIVIIAKAINVMEPSPPVFATAIDP